MDPAAFLAALRAIQNGMHDVLVRQEAIFAKVDVQIKQLNGGGLSSSDDNSAIAPTAEAELGKKGQANKHVDPSLSDSVSSSHVLPKLDLQQAEGQREKVGRTHQPAGAAEGVPVPVAPPTISSVRRASARSSLITPIRRGAPSFGNVVASVMKKKQLEENAGAAGSAFRRVKTSTDHVKRSPAANRAGSQQGQPPGGNASSWDMSRRLQELEDIRATNTQAMVRQTSGFSRTHSLRQLRAVSEEHSALTAAEAAPAPVTFSTAQKKKAATPAVPVAISKKKPVPGDHRSSPNSSPTKPVGAAATGPQKQRPVADKSVPKTVDSKIRLSTNKVAAKTPRKYAAKIVEGVLQHKQAMLLANATKPAASSPLKRTPVEIPPLQTEHVTRTKVTGHVPPAPAPAVGKQPWQSTTKLVLEDKRVPVLRRK